jgi:succinate-semialdehyde dehydrogenase / glutarate-semialdehyde dehydrogenase
MANRSINPATGEELASYPEASAAEIQERLQRGDEAFRAWRRVDFSVRAQHTRAAAGVLRANRDESARLMAREMGKPIAQGEAEVEKCALACEFYAENAERFLTREPVPTEALTSFVTFEPLGVILAVMPWNFPFWQVFRCAVPAMMAGNAVVLKHASNVPGCALAIEEVFRKAGFPPGLFQTLLVGSASVRGLIEAPAVKAVSLTGSVSAGRAIAAQAGANLKKTVLELGGSDPYVVLEDCELERTVESCVNSRLINSGQSCIAAKRFIVVDAIRSRFEELFVARMAEAKVGDPLSRATAVGPLARRDLRDQLHSQVERSLTQGARLLLGGKMPTGKGWFYPPTVLAKIRPGMPAYQEETFGPVAALIGARDEAEAIRMANDSSFGLGAAVFTRNRERGERIAAKELEVGACFVNDFVRSDPRLPFGGIKDSGYGRELGLFGIREFVNIKSVYVK